jgi:hypothetical protein
MLLTFSNSSYQYNGRVSGDLWTNSNGRVIARTRVRPRKEGQQYEFKAPFSTTAFQSDWEALSSTTKDDWSTFADANFGWPIVGSPRILDGRETFLNMICVDRLIDPAAAVPSVPASGPSWQTRPKFFEFAEWVSGTYTLKAETSFASGSTLLFSGLPPTKTGFKPDFAREKIIGNNTFHSGLSANATYGDVHAMMTAAFGSIDSTMKIWGRIWEVQDGFIRVIKDPCTPDPTGEAPSTPTAFDYIVHNGYWEDVAYGEIYFYNSTLDVIATIDVTGLAGSGTTSGTADLEEGYDTDDLAEWDSQGEWNDATPWYTSTETVSEIDPFEWTIPDPWG